MLIDRDRKFLQQCFEMAKAARRAPDQLGGPLEPTWAAIVASENEICDSGAQLPGASEDVVRTIQKAARFTVDPKVHTLYLTIEPSSTYLRLPPVTESIRALGIKRVVVGAENPVLRLRGQGIATLRQFGIEVILADGEEARQCQTFYEDFAKAMNRSLPVLRLLLSLELEPAQAALAEGTSKIFENVFYDAVLVHGQEAMKVKPREGAWLVVIDPSLEVHSLDQLSTKKAIVFQPEGQDVVRPGFYTVPRRDLFLDLAIVLRKLRELGFFSVVSVGNQALFRYAIGAELVDSVVSVVHAKDGAALTLSRLSQVDVTGQGHRLRLLSPRLLQRFESDLMVESEIRLQN